MPSKIDIVNPVFTDLGADRISALSEDSENARKMNSIYKPTLRALLRQLAPSFAKKEKALSRLTETPVLDDDFSYIFQLPSDYIKLNKTDLAESEKYKIKGRKIYCNSTTLSIEYIYFCDDPNEYDDAFIECFQARLEMKLAYPLTKNTNIAQEKAKEFILLFNKTKSIDSQESTPDPIRANKWTNSRI